MKHKASVQLRRIPIIFCLIFSVFVLLIYPSQISNGIKRGIFLVTENVIPALFPFMVLSSYISKSHIIDPICKVLDKPSKKIFKISGKGIMCVLLGFCGGYPIGAKTACEYYKSGNVSQEEVQRLFIWCVNPSPAFIITSVGYLMLGSSGAGKIIYLSCVISSLFSGMVARFAGDEKYTAPNNVAAQGKENIFVESVSSAGKAMLCVCGWVLTFSAVSAGLEIFIKNRDLLTFMSSVFEVTTGCKTAVSEGLSLPLIAAIAGFGGFAVIFQIAPYLERCCVNIKHFICWRIFNSALSAVVCNFFINLYPSTLKAGASVTVGTASLNVSHSIFSAIILVITCVVLILEVDYKKKLC